MPVAGGTPGLDGHSGTGSPSESRERDGGCAGSPAPALHQWEVKARLLLPRLLRLRAEDRRTWCAEGTCTAQSCVGSNQALAEMFLKCLTWSRVRQTFLPWSCLAHASRGVPWRLRCRCRRTSVHVKWQGPMDSLNLVQNCWQFLYPPHLMV